MKDSIDLAQEQQTSESTEALPNLLYHTHLHLASHSPPRPSSSRPTSYISSPKRSTMVTHIAEQASDSIKVQTASAVQYHRAHLSSEVSQVVVKSPSLGSVSSRQRRDDSPHAPSTTSSNSMAPPQRMRHVRHPSNVPLYTSSPTSTNRTRSRRLRESLKPLFQIFTPTDPSTAPPIDTNRQFDESRRLGSKAKVLQDADPNTTQSRRSVSSQFSTSKDSAKSHSSQQRPTRYFRREQSNAAIVEELKCEGLLGGGPTRSRKRKGRDSPNLEKPLPPLVPSMTRRNSEDTFYWESNNCEEKYWAGVADDIARRVSMLTQ